MRILLFLALIATCCLSACSPRLTPAQKEEIKKQVDTSVKPQPLFDLPAVIDESSGLETFHEFLITVNDSGGEPVIYLLDEKGRLVREKELSNQKNIDWEDVAVLDSIIYIGDFGNNYGKRRNLHVIKVSDESVQSFPFFYEEQESFQFKAMKTPFDCESLFVMADQLWLLAKDWSSFNTRLYQLQEEQEIQGLEPDAEYASDLLITGADYDPERKLLICSGYKKFQNYLLLFPQFTPENPFQYPPLRIYLKGLFQAQVEGVCFRDEEIVFSTEKTILVRQQAWSISLHHSAIRSFLSQ